MSKKRKFPKSEDTALNKYERNGLCRMLDEMEWREYQRVKHLTSGYCNATINRIDEVEIHGTITWGVDGQWNDSDDFVINRTELLLI